jgi:hypothetical protein
MSESTFLEISFPSLNYKSPGPCSICDSNDAQSIGKKDFGHSGGDYFEKTRLFPDYGVFIRYFECQNCHFVFTNALDDWSKFDFEQHIYNIDYIRGDKPFQDERPLRNARMLAGLLHQQRESIEILDFGGGCGKLSTTLCEFGFKSETFDIFYGDNTLEISKRFDLITSFEVIEHVPHLKQKEWIKALSVLLNKSANSRILISTELIDNRSTIDWWYLCPRNGHISIHSSKSLACLAASVGLKIFSLNESMHFLEPK